MAASTIDVAGALAAWTGFEPRPDVESGTLDLSVNYLAAAIGEDMRQDYVRKAILWLEHHQLEDGGWGEGCESYANPELRGKGPSTPSQTAWALMALIAAGDAHGEAARRGVEYLLQTQQAHGSWDEPYFTGTGFPNDFMINYHMYRDYWPLTALGQYRQAVGQARNGSDGARI